MFIYRFVNTKGIILKQIDISGSLYIIRIQNRDFWIENPCRFVDRVIDLTINRKQIIILSNSKIMNFHETKISLRTKFWNIPLWKLTFDVLK